MSECVPEPCTHRPKACGNREPPKSACQPPRRRRLPTVKHGRLGLSRNKVWPQEEPAANTGFLRENLELSSLAIMPYFTARIRQTLNESDYPDKIILSSVLNGTGLNMFKESEDSPAEHGSRKKLSKNA